jgi:hypothetical protein
VQTMSLEFTNPPSIGFLDGYGIQVVEFLSPVPDDGNEVRIFQDREMLHHSLPAGIQMLA